MAYSIQKLAELAGVSSRTLRYYDQIGLLAPAYITEAGYRMYECEQVDLLQEILFYRALDFPLEKIMLLLKDPKHNRMDAMKKQRELLIQKKDKLNQMIETLDVTIDHLQGGKNMADQEKFKGLKEQAIARNEEKYGKEIRGKYGDEIIDASNQKHREMTEEVYASIDQLAEEIIEQLKEAFKTNDPASEQAQKVAELHKQWICYYWPKYTKRAHAGLAQTYVDDERFQAHYDAHGKGLAKFLRDAIWIYTGMDELILPSDIS